MGLGAHLLSIRDECMESTVLLLLLLLLFWLHSPLGGWIDIVFNKWKKN